MIEPYPENMLHVRKSSPIGSTWEKWAELWWKWCYAEPEGISPASDHTGALAGKNQTIANVWFLAGTFGGNAERDCTIPKGRSILIPIINDLISYAEFSHLKNEAELRSYAKDDIDTTSLIEASIDNVHVEDILYYRVQSNLFALVVPLSKSREGGIQDTQAISDGYWLFLKPLSAGRHTIVIRGEKSFYDDVQCDGYQGENGRFKTGVTYHIVIE